MNGAGSSVQYVLTFPCNAPGKAVLIFRMRRVRMGRMEDLILPHQIASYECGADLLLKPECYLLFCQEMAELHASRNKMGYDWVLAHNMIWVEVQGDFELLRRPRWKEQICLRTNTGKASPLQARRFVEMRDADGELLGRADLMWVLIDVQTRRPMPLKRAQLEVPEECPRTVADPLRDFPMEAPVLATAYLVASRRDVDFNGHINNSAYLTWALDTLPHPPGTAPRRIHVAYKHESLIDEPLSITHQVVDTLSRHVIAGDGKTRAEILMEWA